MNLYSIILTLSPDLKRHLAQLCYGLPNVRWVEEENFHVLLRYLGPLSSDSLATVQEALKTVSFFPFTIYLKGLEHSHAKNDRGSLGIKVYSDPEKSITQLKQEIDKKLKGLDIDLKERSFQPHVPLAHYTHIQAERLSEYLGMYQMYQSEKMDVQQFELIFLQETPKRLFYRKVESYLAFPLNLHED
jgi:2'-5' RNA ligase